MKLVVTGASTTPVCGVRDCAHVLAEPLARAGAENEIVWWERDRSHGLRRTLADLATHVARVRAAAADADAVLWHYSAFSYGPRGLPVATRRLTEALASGPPLVAFFHELVFPWNLRDVRLVHAVAHRAVLRSVMRRTASAIVTTDERAAWLAGRRWLPRRPVSTVPVPSNIAPDGDAAPREPGALQVGVLGFGTPANDVEASVSAVASLRRRGVDARLTLIGAPGRESAQAERWVEAAARADAGDALRFTGVLEAREVSRALAALDVVLVPDRVGPTSRRGSVAAALAHGKPVLGLAGEQRWRAAVAAGAIVTVPAPRLADELERLAGDPVLRRRHGARARAFYEETMSPDVVASRIVDIAGTVVAR